MGIFNVKECNFVFAFYSIFPFKPIFPKKGPIFPKNVGFSGEPLGKRLFPSDSRRIFAPAFSKIGAAN